MRKCRAPQKPTGLQKAKAAIIRRGVRWNKHHRAGCGVAAGSALMLQGAAGLISGVCACGVAGGRCYHPRLMQMTGAEVSPEYSWILDRSDAEYRDFRVFSVSGAF